MNKQKIILQTKKETAQEIIKLVDTIENENLNSTFDEWREYKGIRNRITDKYLK